MKKHIFSSNLIKNEDFFKISKTNDCLNYLEKLVEQHFSKTLYDASESAKNNFFCDATKVENVDKKCLTLSKGNQEGPFKHIRFVRSKSPVKGLRPNSIDV
jgi:transposase